MAVCRLQGAMSVDSITDLDDNQSRLLEALQLSLPAEAQNKKEKARDKKLSLNPIYRQVPRLVDSCCQHLEKHGKQTCLSAIKSQRLSFIPASYSLRRPLSVLCSLDQALGQDFLCEKSLQIGVFASPQKGQTRWCGLGDINLTGMQTPSPKGSSEVTFEAKELRGGPDLWG